MGISQDPGLLLSGPGFCDPPVSTGGPCGSFYMFGGGLSENSPHGLLYLNTCSPVGRAVWEGLGSMALLEEMRHRGQALRFQKPMPIPVSVFSLSGLSCRSPPGQVWGLLH